MEPCDADKAVIASWPFLLFVMSKCIEMNFRIVIGEPVSVATGEYVETWRDFLIPATLALNGARFMGLKFALPAGSASPLGPCQISMFDEVFSNPERRQLDFFQATARRSASRDRSTSCPRTTGLIRTSTCARHG